MAVDEQTSAYSTTAASNTPAGTATVGPDLDNHLRDMKKNIRAVGQTFLGSSEGNYDGALKVDNSASPTWTLGISQGGAFISLIDIDVSANTSTPYAGSTVTGTFAQEHLSESTASARDTIMGTHLAAVAPEAGTASASHALSLQGLGPPIGSVQWTIESTAPDGWLFLNADTMGNTSASATHTGAIFEVLYTKIWDSTTNSEVPVEGGRGASASADFAANKNLTLPDARGRSVIGTGQGSGLTDRTNADTDGEEDHLLTSSESGLPSHNHSVSRRSSSDAGANDNTRLATGNTGGTTGTFNGIDNSSQNASSAHNNMQPWLALNAIIKY